jgi:uncharacterized protein (DUF302 family)
MSSFVDIKEDAMRTIILLFSLLALAACQPQTPKAPAAAGGSGHMKMYSKEGKFENVRDDLKAAIEGRGLKIDNHSFISEMLDRTGKDIGATAKVYAGGEAFSFCSAVVSRKTMEADADNIVFCPYTITVYETTKEPGKVHVAFRIPQKVGSDASKAALTEVENLLDGISKEALNIK